MKRFKRLESISFGPSFLKSSASGMEESDNTQENSTESDPKSTPALGTSLFKSTQEASAGYLSLYNESKRKLGEKAGSLWKEFTEGYTVRFGNKDKKK